MDHSPRSQTASANATRMVDVLVPVALDLPPLKPELRSMVD